MTQDELLKIIDQAAEEKWTELDLTGQDPNELPPEIGKLTQLEALVFSKNDTINHRFLGDPPDRLPPEIGQLTHQQQQKLFRSHNPLSALPPEIGQLAHLRRLSLTANLLTELPPQIGQLTHLQQLDLGANLLTELPAEIGQLTHLQQLDLGYNSLSELPAEIGQLTHLQQLDLSANQLSALPPEIGQLTHLHQLDLSFNYDLVDPPPEIISRGTGAILNYLRQKLEQGQDHLYEAKLLIVGEGGAGKTTLANKLLQPHIELDSQQISTEGIDVHRWDFKFRDSTEFRVNVWDFGGQEIYHATHQFFLTKRSLYALVVDTRKDNTDLRYWLSVVDLRSQSSPAIIIKNEKDDRPCNVNESELRREFINLKETLSTNFKTNRGLEGIQQVIRQYITALPHVGTALPKKWVEVRQSLEADKRNYISLTEYSQICKDHGFTERKDQLQLSEYLHDLGVCLHFQEDLLLRKSIILKPEWATTAVYSALDTKEVVNNQGHFNQELLEAIWSDDDYIDMQGELLQLMMRFKLCYEIPGCSDNYIAPQLLDANAPTYDWDNSNNQIFRYRYEFMPKGMITRLIVDLHNFIEAQELVWKTGAVFTNGTARAEVIEHYGKGEIRIRVSGQEQKVWLSVINHELDKIHQSYKNLQYVTLIPCNCSVCKDSQTPETYTYERLQKRLQKQKYFFDCEASFEQVDARKLLDDILYQASVSQEPDQQKQPATSMRGLPPQDTAKILNNTPIQTMTSNFNPVARLKLIQSLGAMPPAQFEEMVFALDLPAGVMSSFQAPQGQRAKELLDWAKGPTGTGLDSVLQVLNTYVPLADLGIAVPDQAPVAPPITPSTLSTSPSPLATTKEIFISFKWRTDSEQVANQIDKVFQAQGITIRRDFKDIQYRDSIQDFMNALGRGKCVIAVIDDAYLKSESCMFELVEILANGDFRDRIFPIVLPDAEIYKPVKRIRYIQYWEQEIAELDEAMKTVSAANLQGFRESIDLYTRIRNTIAELVKTLKDTNTLTLDTHADSGFAELFKAIEQRLAD